MYIYINIYIHTYIYIYIFIYILRKLYLLICREELDRLEPSGLEAVARGALQGLRHGLGACAQPNAVQQLYELLRKRKKEFEFFF